MLNTYPCNPFPISSEQLHKGDNEDLQAQINAIKDGTAIDSFGDVETALDTKADNDVIAPEFDAEAGTYEIGDKVMYEGKLYEFTSAHETAGEWDPTEVVETTVADELSSLESGLTNMGNITKLGYVQGTGEVSLSDGIDNYRYLFFTVGYYDSGFPSYGTAMFPTLMAPRGIGARVVCATDDDTNAKSVVFTLDDTHNKLSVAVTYDANRYLALYGVV